MDVLVVVRKILNLLPRIVNFWFWYLAVCIQVGPLEHARNLATDIYRLGAAKAKHDNAMGTWRELTTAWFDAKLRLRPEELTGIPVVAQHKLRSIVHQHQHS